MKRVNIYRRSIGVNFNDDSTATIKLWAPFANSAGISINGQKAWPLNAGEKGYWELTTDRLKPGMTYGFVLDGQDALPDPVSLYQPDGVHGSSTAFDIQKFNRIDTVWKNPDLSEYIIYELHTGTFTPEGTFEAIEKKLDYLVELRVTAIELMPIAQFPGERNWGYDGVFPFAVHNSYGGPEALQKLVEACHSKGLAVVLDVVYNHLGPEGNYLPKYGSYFTEKYKTPWGGAINFDDAWCDGVREYFIENALMWFRDFHIDALRLDAVHAIKDFSPKHILAEIKAHVDELMRVTGRRHHLIIECDLNDTRFIKPQAQGGYGIDAQWTDEFHHALRVATGQKQDGYYADFNGVGHLAKAYRDAYVYDGQYSEERHKYFGVKADGQPGQQFVVFSQNHDQVGNRMLGERTGTLVSFETQKLLAAAVIVSPYLPLLFMGEEYGETNPFLYFVSHTDPELIAAVRKGRGEEFKHFMGDAEAPDPQSPNTFENSKLQWELPGTSSHQTMLRYYQALIRLRKTDPVLRILDRNRLRVELLEAEKVIVLERWNEERKLLCLLNFSDKAVNVPSTQFAGRWQKMFDSAALEWDGPADAPVTVSPDNDFSLQPKSAIIYTQNHV